MKDERKKRNTRISLFPYIIIYMYVSLYIYKYHTYLLYINMQRAKTQRQKHNNTWTIIQRKKFQVIYEPYSLHLYRS